MRPPCSVPAAGLRLAVFKAICMMLTVQGDNAEPELEPEMEPEFSRTAVSLDYWPQ